MRRIKYLGIERLRMTFWRHAALLRLGSSQRHRKTGSEGRNMPWIVLTCPFLTKRRDGAPKIWKVSKTLACPHSSHSEFGSLSLISI